MWALSWKLTRSTLLEQADIGLNYARLSLNRCAGRLRAAVKKFPYRLRTDLRLPAADPNDPDLERALHTHLRHDYSRLFDHRTACPTHGLSRQLREQAQRSQKNFTCLRIDSKPETESSNKFFIDRKFFGENFGLNQWRDLATPSLGVMIASNVLISPLNNAIFLWNGIC